jgi:transcription antitermination factor NusG
MMHESVNGLRHSANHTAHRLADAVPSDVAHQSAPQDSIWWQSHWFAIHTKTRRESFAATNVCALSLDVFLPELKTDYIPRGVARHASKPLFVGYFFARFCPEVALEAVRRSRGVLRAVSSGRNPLPVNEDVIREIQSRVDADGYIRIRRRALMPGDLVSIEEGPFQGMMGRVERELDDRKRVAILMETLWQARVLIEKRYVKAEAA